MRTIWLCAAATLLAFPAAATHRFDPLTAAKFHASQSCDHAYAMCQARHPDKLDGCRVLFEAAKASGGHWGEPPANTEAHMRGVRRIFCVP